MTNALVIECMNEWHREWPLLPKFGLKYNYVYSFWHHFVFFLKCDNNENDLLVFFSATFLDIDLLTVQLYVCALRE